MFSKIITYWTRVIVGYLNPYFLFLHELLHGVYYIVYVHQEHSSGFLPYSGFLWLDNFDMVGSVLTLILTLCRVLVQM